jgi:hypothetical protein
VAQGIGAVLLERSAYDEDYEQHLPSARILELIRRGRPRH